MRIYSIKNLKGNILFQEKTSTFGQCLEHAIQDNIDLSHADLTKQNLSNLELDGGLLDGADFTSSNLTGTNISEAALNKARFINCQIALTCLACSDLRDTQWDGARFGATDITDSILNKARFSTLSCFTLNFATTRTMKNCRFTTLGNITYDFSKPPIVINGLSPQPFIMLDHTNLLGHQNVPANDWLPYLRSFSAQEDIKTLT